MSGAAQVHPLKDNQRLAVAPEDTVWLSASAGTGKTQVLSSRVLRLLLQDGVDPSQILCLTFTKAGATEMAARINATLATWVRLSDEDLFRHLEAIGAPSDPDTRARARTLFAAVLDCPGGGLRIDTIHAFAQWLLAAFPTEAGLIPGTRPMEDRDRDLLARQVLAQLLLDAEARGDAALLDSLAALSLRMAPEDVERFLLRCAGAHDLWLGPASWVPPLRPQVNRLLGIAADANDSHVAALCGDDAFDVAALRRCRQTLSAWDTVAGREGTAAIDAWLAQEAAVRALAIDDLYLGLFTKTTNAPRQLNNVLKRDPDYEAPISRVGAAIAAVRELRAQLALSAWLGPALELGRRFALAWHEAKQREGLIDFDDQIRQAADLLGKSHLSEWIRYKLDRRFDHILVDEAQDTNEAQWQIIQALTGDFFTGLGAHGDRLRTLFVVGDYKQAIFRFQGTSPENFEAARRRVEQQLRGLRDEAEAIGFAGPVPRLQELGLATSFRTAQPVLDFVDRAIGHVGHAAFGLAAAPEPHKGEARPGYVALWRPVGLPDEAESDPEDEAEEGGENWLSRPDRQMAELIARQVREWMDHGYPLVKGGARRAGPGDVMILVRKRKELAGLIIARLHAAGVPVAGVDRLRLGAPLAVKDLVAALRFAAQPLDDLNLAALLVSPLVGWTQEQLLDHGYRERGVRLWAHLRRSSHPEVHAARDLLDGVLARADYELPQALLHWLLVGPWRGREKLVARLGREAEDPIDELLNAASAYAGSATASLVGFLAWFDAGEGELKREAGKSDGLVRVMTVHGSKGLQAPIVILADAAGNPETSRGAPLDLAEPEFPGQAPRKVPLPGLRKEEKGQRVLAAEDAAKAAEGEEHWRLLYVAMTRAEEALFIGGALGSREKEPAPQSWYARLAELFDAAGALDDDVWGHRFECGTRADLPPVAAPPPVAAALPAVPDWLHRPVAAEPRPPRPLAPSSLGEDLSPDPPLAPGAGLAAARRGVLVHKLLERLPQIADTADRQAAADRWLARHAVEVEPAERAEILASVLDVLARDEWRELFSPEGLAEVPIAAVVGGQVVAGTIDRLLIGRETIRLVDFKTARRPPLDAAGIPAATRRQLAAYAAALEATYPGRRVEAAVLYTQAPRLIALPAEEIARHKAALFAAQ